MEEQLSIARRKLRAKTNQFNASRPRSRKSTTPPLPKRIAIDDSPTATCSPEDLRASKTRANSIHYKKSKVLDALVSESQGDPSLLRELLEKLFQTQPVKEALSGTSNDGLVQLMAHELAENVRMVLRLLQRHSAKKTQWQSYQALLSSVLPCEWRTSRFSSEQWRTLLGSSKESMRAARLRRKFVLEDSGRELFASARRERKDSKLADSKFAAAVERWCSDPENCYIQPGHAVIRQHRDIDGNPKAHHRKGNCTVNCIAHAIHRQTEPDNVAHQRFLKSPEAEAAGVESSKDFSARLFRSLRPWWVEKFKRQFCVCIYHLSFVKLLEGYRLAGLKLHKHCTCSCKLCEAGGCHDHPWTKDLDAFASQVLCSPPTAACCTGECQDCGWDKAAFNACEVEMKARESFASWTELEKLTVNVRTRRKEFEERKSIVHVRKEGTLADVKDRLAQAAFSSVNDWKGWVQEKPFFLHRFVAKHQAAVLNNQIDNLADHPESIVVVMDFAMNHKHENAQSLQEEHWLGHMTSLLPCVVYRAVDDAVWAESYVVITQTICTMTRHSSSNPSKIFYISTRKSSLQKASTS
mmetsp:Transcript_23132/g.34650  ORF Transcript_23132/g.34650 Transcript_23132/m.34650 type:complete len:581 (+) Transcript_23132:632-2374(+)